MREIRSPLDGILTPFQARAAAAVDAYAVQGLSPLLVADFATPYYRKAGSTSTFDSTFTHSRAGNATMVDSDGLIKWAPHNLLTYSEQFEDGSWTKTVSLTSGVQDPDGGNNAFTATNDGSSKEAVYKTVSVTSGAKYVTGMFVRRRTGTGKIYMISINGSGGGVREIIPTSTWQFFDTPQAADKIASGTTGYCGIEIETPSDQVDIYAARVYRSDLGGMVNNPDRGDSYVPTTSAAVYQARRNHYTYNGTSWVNSGLLLETEARTNLVTDSNDFTDASWTPTGSTIDADDALSPDGNVNSDSWGINSGITITTSALGLFTSGVLARLATTSSISLSATPYTHSCFVRAGSGVTHIQLRVGTALNLTGTSYGAIFRLSDGFVENASGTAEAVDYGDGWYRVSHTFTPTATTHYVGFWFWNETSKTTDGSEYISIYGAQLEAAATPSSYIPTPGSNPDSTGTRPTESLQIAAADMPWPTPNVIGAELVDNGDFELGDNGDWSKGAGWSIGGGVASCDGTQPSSSLLSQTGSGFVVGKPYLFSFTISSVTGVGFRPELGGDTSAGYFTGSGSFTAVFVVSSTTPTINIRAGTAGVTGTIDNISVREIDPLSVSLQMQGKITYADEGVEAQQTFARWYDDASNYITIDLDTDSTDTGEVNFEQQDGTGGTGTVTIDAYTPGTDGKVAYNIASRNTSTAINGATDGTAGTEDTTPTALPDLSAKDFSLGYDYMGTIAQFRAWNKDIGDTGIEDATS